MKTEPVLRIIPGRCKEAEIFAAKLYAMYKNYKGKLDKKNEMGIHRYSFKTKDGRMTVFALVKVGGVGDWSSPQIRSYVTDPYNLVKDLRTGKETEKVNEVFAGNLDLVL